MPMTPPCSRRSIGRAGPVAPIAGPSRMAGPATMRRTCSERRRMPSMITTTSMAPLRTAAILATLLLTSLNPSHSNCKFPSSLSSGNGNFSGSTAASGGVDLSSSSSIVHHRNWGSRTNYLLFAMALVL